MNTFMNQMTKDANIDYTENGARTHVTTNSKVLDMFSRAFRHQDTDYNDQEYTDPGQNQEQDQMQQEVSDDQ